MQGLGVEVRYISFNYHLQTRDPVQIAVQYDSRNQAPNTWRHPGGILGNLTSEWEFLDLDRSLHFKLRVTMDALVFAQEIS